MIRALGVVSEDGIFREVKINRRQILDSEVSVPEVAAILLELLKLEKNESFENRQDAGAEKAFLTAVQWCIPTDNGDVGCLASGAARRGIDPRMAAATFAKELAFHDLLCEWA